MAALNGVKATIKQYLIKGGSPNATDSHGQTLLMLASSRGHSDICQLLLDFGALPNPAMALPIALKPTTPLVIEHEESMSCADSAGLLLTTPPHAEVPPDLRAPSSSMNGVPVLGPTPQAGDPGTTESVGVGLKVIRGDPPAHVMEPGDPIVYGFDAPSESTSLRSEGVDFDGILGSQVMASTDSIEWEVEPETPTPIGDDSCLTAADSLHERLSSHFLVDPDPEWSDIDVILPTIRRGSLEYGSVDEGLLRQISGLITYGSDHGWVPEQWVHAAASSDHGEEPDPDLANRIRMLLGESGILVEEAPLWLDYLPLGPNGDPSDLPGESISFLEDVASGYKDSLAPYFRTIQALPLLTIEEEQRFGCMWQVDRDLGGLHALVEGNYRFVIREARKFRGLGLDILDLVSEGNLGLIEAAKRFDPFRENRFLTYASWWIRQAFFHALAEHGSRIRLPQKVSRQLLQLNRLTAALSEEFNRPPTVAEIVERGRFTAEEVDRLQELAYYSEGFGSGSDAWEPAGIDPDSLEQDVEPPAGSILDQESFLEQVKASLAALSQKERLILELHYGLHDREPVTLEQIGRAFIPPISRERVRQLEERAFEKIRIRNGEVLALFLLSESSDASGQATDSRRDEYQEEADDSE